MLKKMRRKVKTIVTRPFRKKRGNKPNTPPTVSPPQPSSPTMSPPRTGRSHPFLFPKTHSSALPDPSPFFASHLLATPLPTNSFFQNFVLKNGDQPEYIHPYLVKSSQSSLSLCFSSLSDNPAFIFQPFIDDLIISTLNNPNPVATHIVSAFDDLSVTLDFPSSNIRFYLVRGSPFLTCNVMSSAAVSISTIHAILELSPNSSCTKYTIKLNNNQIWLLYSSSPLSLSHDLSRITSSMFSGVIRIALLPDSNPRFEAILDRFSSCYPVTGEAVFTKPFCLEYRWEKRGWGDLLMLAHPLHLRLLSGTDCSVTVLEDFKYTSIDGELVGVAGDSWVLKSDPVSISWHSVKGIEEESYPEIIEALVKDVDSLNTIATSSSYFYGKLIARGARLALIAEEVCYLDVIPAIRKFLKDTIEPWLDGTFGANGFLYESKWGGLVTKQGSTDSGADFGFGVYNDHHYHLGYFVYGIAVLAKIDASWGRKYRPQAYSLMADFMNLSRRANSDYTRLRCFDLWKLHSWAGGLTEFADGRNQESTSEALNAYYSAALMGLAYGDSHLISVGSTISAFEIQAAQTWWHVREESNLYPKEFVKDNRVVGVLWSTKRDSGLWFAPAEWKECRLGIQLLPLLPVSEALFSDIGFVKELVAWTYPALGRAGVGEGWKGFLYALQGIYDKQCALDNIRSLNGYDDGNSLTNLLWWTHSRQYEGEGFEKEWKLSWFRHYFH
ncbi:endo-1,3(4)-beta-glucanase 2 [Dorcoceras hygrometricum]|uniref:glucan endo-1,3-beta-D-glucosidase n=1 Tax=Dorcoceras hygrometricum TaxID=472368 RepID=A0A2Z7AT06_9LAMI|nr:endo-1,3(4)-beta-glucanase 2 [Dorcoceras hygrometricum]